MLYLSILLFTVYQLPVFGVVPRIDCDQPSGISVLQHL